MGKAPKTTNVYESTSAGLDDILTAAIQDEPPPTPAAVTLVEDARNAGPFNPLSGAADPLPAQSLDRGEHDGGGGDLVASSTPREAAENMVTLLFAVAPSGDWQPEDEAEREELITAVERVFEYRGFAPTLPPELALVAVMGKYTRKRMQKPAIRERLTPFLQKIPILGKLMGAEPPAEPLAPSTFAALPKMSPPHDA